MRKIYLLFIIISLFISFPQNAFSATVQTISISNTPTIIDESQEFDVDITFSCPSCSGDSYLRGVFYPSGSSYFGYTEDNNGNWSNAAAGNCTTYFKIAQSDLDKNGNWSGNLKFKTDIGSPYYKGPVEYSFKIGRYTPSCSSPSVWSAETIIAITGPTPTPTPTSTPTPTPTPQPTPTPSPTPTPTRIPTPAKVPTPVPTKKPLSTLFTNLNSATLSGMPGSVFGISTKSAVKVASKSPSPKKTLVEDMKKTQSSSFPYAPVIIIIGGVLICACGILIYLKERKRLF